MGEFGGLAKAPLFFYRIFGTNRLTSNDIVPSPKDSLRVVGNERCRDLAKNFQGHPTDCFCRIYVRKTCNRLKFSVREMSSRAFLIKIN